MTEVYLTFHIARSKPAKPYTEFLPGKLLASVIHGLIHPIPPSVCAKPFGRLSLNPFAYAIVFCKCPEVF